jgi:parvulin-like peptidyl-prolyl isomerase
MLPARYVAVWLIAAAVLPGCKSGQTAPAPTAPAPTSPRPAPAEPRANAAPPPAAVAVAPASPTTTRAADEVVARVGDQVVTLDELQGPLIQAYGLNILLNLVQLEMTAQEAAGKGISISDADVTAEREATLRKMFPDAEVADYPQLFEQFLAQQRISPAEFDIVIRTNALLRAIARPMVDDKITDEHLEEAYRTLYGEKAKVRHIQMANMQEIQEAKRRVDGGEPFEKVAREMSRNERTRAVGGELPAFTRATTSVPQSLRDAAFSLKVGEVSDAVLADDAYHLLKLDAVVEPKAVKFEDVKESIRQDLRERAEDATIRDLRNSLGQKALASMVIEDPELRRQFDERRQRQEAEVRGRKAVMEQIDRERRQLAEEQMRAATQPATAPSTDLPAPKPVEPSAQPQPDRPPATMSGEPAAPPASPDQPLP